MDPRDLRKNAASDDRLDAVLHALSDRTRRSLLRRLSTSPAMVTELVAPFAITRTAVAKHLRVLENAGLISKTVEGRVRRCAFTAGPLREIEDWLNEYRAFWTQNLDALARYAEKGADFARPRRRKR